MIVDEENNIDVYEATIARSTNNGYSTFEISKGELVIDDVDAYKILKV